ncbi:MAG: glycosyltransferase family 2 protein [Chitinophagaceae bacterium]
MSDFKPTSLTVVLPCYNEEAIIRPNVQKVAAYLDSKKEKYSWEILLINDGSKDNSGRIADELTNEMANVRVVHHPVNLNLGRALQTGFRHAKGDVIVVLDIDLSYSVDYIEQMTDTLIINSADIVLASPYMKGGKVTAVPYSRKVMSKWVNAFMRISAQDKFHTFTAMARAYRTDFIRTLNLKTKDYEINPEIMYKAMILRARIIEIPAHLDWTEQNKFAGKRTSSMRVIRGLFSGIMSAFIFRPYMFFLVIGSILMLLSMYELVWLLHDTLADMKLAHLQSPPPDSGAFSFSLYLQFKKNPQTFIVGGVTFIASIQFLSLGFLSLQSKRYFEELFHLGTSIRKENASIE